MTVSAAFRSIPLVPCEQHLRDEEKRLLDALHLRARCLAVLRYDMSKSDETMNTQPVCILENEKDLLSAFSSPMYHTLDGKAVIVDDDSDLAGAVLRVISDTTKVQLLKYELA